MKEFIPHNLPLTVESLKIKNSKLYINVELFARLKKGI